MRLAVNNSDRDILRYIVENMRVPLEDGILEVAIKKGDREIVEYLIGRGSKVSAKMIYEGCKSMGGEVEVVKKIT